MLKRKSFRVALICIIGFIVIFLSVVFGVQFATGTGIFYTPGVIYYDEKLDEAQLETLSNIFTEDIKIDEDLYISVNYYLEKPELTDGEFLYDILVPVTDFYSSENNIVVNDVDILFSNTGEQSFELISLDNLDSSRKLLKINGNYYLDEYDKGAIFVVIKFVSEGYEKEIKPLIGDVFAREWPESDNVLTFAQTGVTALSRGMNAQLSKIGDATYFSEYIKEYLSSFDLTHTSNESSFTDFANSNNICSDKRFINTLLDIGLDIVELTGNHNRDCGDLAAIETIDLYNENQIKIVGGGKTADEASEPLKISQKNSNITMLAYNLSTGGATYDDTPGANQYYEEVAKAQIEESKANGDFVIVDIQYYECNAYVSEYEDSTCDYADSAAGDQVGFFRHLVDLGADIVVGTSAHQPQTFELYGDGAIYYGLGNLFFDQVWWPGTTRSLILAHYFYNGKLLQTKIVPTIYGSDMQTKLLDEDTATWFLERLISARP